MNYLAHAYFSFHDPGILAGNMISDFVKGKQQFLYPQTIQKGIRLHRAIDTFTDAHAATKAAKQYLKPAAGLYAGAFMDVVYDHFLALSMSETDLQHFASEVYEQLALNKAWFPEKFARMFPYMQQQNWLYHYRFTWGIENSFGGIVRRARYIDDASAAFSLFNDHYTILQVYAEDFLPAAARFASSQFDVLLNE